MIYVILESRLSPDITKEDIIGCKELNLSFELCIKIGFSTDFYKRKMSYVSDTPRFDILYTYEEGTHDDEKRLHKYFEKYKTSDLNGNEWFKFDKEFIEFFNNNPTIEDIRSKISHIRLYPSDKVRQRAEEEEYLNLQKIIYSIVYTILDLDLDPEVVDFSSVSKENKGLETAMKADLLFNYYKEQTRPKTVDEFLDYIKPTLSEEDYNLIVQTYNNYLGRLGEIDKELDTFNKIKHYDHKMEFVCQLSLRLTTDKFKIFLDVVPKSFKNYYTILGPDRCKANKYRKLDMEKEYQRLLNNQGVSLDDRIYDTFHAGDRLRKTDIKTRLEKIYQDSNFQQTAKATDLKTWFNLKEIQFRVKGTNIREAGFELISRVTPPTP